MQPGFVPNDEDPEAAKANAEVIQIAVQTGIPVPLNFALEKLNIPKAEEGEEIVEAPSVQAPNDGNGPPDNLSASLRHRLQGDGRARFYAKDATGKLVDQVLEDLTGVEAKWLGTVKPWFRALLAKAQSEVVTDADFAKALERAQRELPELFHLMDKAALTAAMEGALGAACVNGAVRGQMQRTGRRARPNAEVSA
jgi:phage gp29-like protein